MSNPINNTQFDSRDLIEYKEELETELVESWNDYWEEQYEDHEEIDDFDEVDLEDEAFSDAYGEEIEHYENVRDFIEELEGYGDFIHGTAIIHEDYFNEAMQNDCEELYNLEGLPWFIESHIDWDAVAQELSHDYTIAMFEDEDYYIRS